MITLIISHIFNDIDFNNDKIDYRFQHKIDVLLNGTYTITYAMKTKYETWENTTYSILISNIPYIPESLLNMIRLIGFPDSSYYLGNTNYSHNKKYMSFITNLKTIFIELLQKDFITNLQTQDIIKTKYEHDILKLTHNKDTIISELNQKIIKIINDKELITSELETLTNNKELIVSELNQEIINLKDVNEKMINTISELTDLLDKSKRVNENLIVIINKDNLNKIHIMKELYYLLSPYFYYISILFLIIICSIKFILK